jgi:MFS family permease
MVFLFMLINFADKAVVGLSSTAIISELGLSHTQFGMLGSAFFWLFAVSGVLVGFMANRLSTKRIMLTMSAIWSLSLLPISGHVGFAVLLGSRVVLGAAEGPAFPVSMHAVYQWFVNRDRALPSGIVASGAAFGAGIVAPIVTWVIVGYGWHTAFSVLSAIGFLWTAAWFWVGRDGPLREANLGQGVRTDPIGYRQLLFSRTVIGVFIVGFAAYWLIALNLVWLANYLIKSVRLTPSAAAWVLALPSALQIVLGIGIAWLSQRLTQTGYSSRLSRGLLGCGCVIAAGALAALMPFVPVTGLKILMIGMAFSIGNVIFMLGSTLIGEVTPTAKRGALLGITNSIHTLAGLVAPLTMGILVDVQTDPSRGFRTGFLASGVLVATLGAVAAWLINPEDDLARRASMPSTSEIPESHQLPSGANGVP